MLANLPKCVAFLAAVLLPVSVWGQETRGTILGRITDPSGAVIAGAEVRATNVATGVSAVAISYEAGDG